MPEYLAPGVYAEEVPGQPRSIEGIPTSTAGFVGPAAFGPVGMPVPITAAADYERIFGPGPTLAYDGSLQADYLWHAVRAFFTEGGKRLYLSRVFVPLAGTWPPKDAAGRESFGTAAAAPRAGAAYADGHGRAAVPASGGMPALQLRARFPGGAGNLTIRITVEAGPESLVGEAVCDAAGHPVLGADGQARLRPVLAGLRAFDLAWIRRRSPPPGEPAAGRAWVASPVAGVSGGGGADWRFATGTDGLPAGDLVPPRPGDPASGDSVRPLRLAVAVIRPDGVPTLRRHLAFDPRHVGEAGPDSLAAIFGPGPADARDLPELPLAVEPEGCATGLEVLDVLLRAAAAQGWPLAAAIADPGSAEGDRTLVVSLQGGNDGRRPTATDYAGSVSCDGRGTGLEALAAVDEIAIVAAPGASWVPSGGDAAAARNVAAALVAHAERMRWRMAVLDGPNGASLQEIRAFRTAFDSSRAALYYPWVTVKDPVSGDPLALPPSGFVAGIHARTDLMRGVHKAPANEEVRSAIGFESAVDKAQQETLNHEGINCLRTFPDRGHLVWGARTLGSDPEWKYVNVRRYFNYLECSIDCGIQWAVFEPNAEPLWVKLRQAIGAFLHAEWRAGRPLGATPEEAYFVRCDRSTMSQADLDAGRLVCLVGVAILKPAEFVTFRIGQWTADRGS